MEQQNPYSVMTKFFVAIFWAIISYAIFFIITSPVTLVLLAIFTIKNWFLFHMTVAFCSWLVVTSYDIQVNK